MYKYFIPHPYKHIIHGSLFYIFLKDILVLCNFEPNKNPANETENEKEILPIIQASH